LVKSLYSSSSSSYYYYYQVVESMDMDLITYMSRGGGGGKGTTAIPLPLHRREALLITYAIARGMASLHSRLIGHYDLSPQSILLRVDHRWVGGMGDQ